MPSLAIAAIPSLAIGYDHAIRVGGDGDIETLTPDEAARRLDQEPHLIIHALGAARALKRAYAGVAQMHLDLLDLFAFVRPGALTLPTALGLARALGLAEPETLEDAAVAMGEIGARLLAELARKSAEERARAASTALVMARAGWPWAEAVLGALDAPEAKASFAAWTHLPEWEEPPPRGQPGSAPVLPENAVARLSAMLGRGREERRTQVEYAALAVRAFDPRDAEGHPQIVLAEAGTGTGKTAGYIAPASLWAEANDGAVWISTYTKNLQRQIDQELARLYPDPGVRREKAVVRKGRENYLCVLNFQEAAARAGLGLGRETTVLGLIARWLGATRDGDLIGGDLPPWVAAEAQALNLTDRRGECIYAACPHYRICFIERNVRRARAADLVVANHALVMTQAARDMSAPGEECTSGREARSRFVFDEAHHLFHAADSTFASHLSAREGADMRRWLRGPETQGRGRGLADRLGDLTGDETIDLHLAEALRAAGALPGPGAMARIGDGQPRGAMEQFLSLVHAQVRARAGDAESEYDLECEIHPLIEGVAAAAHRLAEALAFLERPLLALAARLRAMLADPEEEFETPQRLRYEALARGLEWRARLVITSWRQMAQSLEEPAPSGFAQWFGIARSGRRIADCGMFRHWIDPTIPFAGTVLARAHGALLTSATLTDHDPDAGADADWRSAELRTGATHLPLPAIRGRFASPFDYGAQARIFVVRDIDRRSIDSIAAAYRLLFEAAGGGALGLFTAIRTLRAVHARIAPALEAKGFTLHAQHVDPFDMGVLIDMFRAERNACLLGTDAARDGVDVPGQSLRLLVFDRVPWPRPDILHKARRAVFGGRAYDEMTTRLKLAQAFGRLIRTREDRGCFVMLDAQTPSRLLAALPGDIPISRCGLDEAIAGVGEFLAAAPGLALAAPAP